jgi:hypothetical protein
VLGDAAEPELLAPLVRTYQRSGEKIFSNVGTTRRGNLLLGKCRLVTEKAKKYVIGEIKKI